MKTNNTARAEIKAAVRKSILERIEACEDMIVLLPCIKGIEAEDKLNLAGHGFNASVRKDELLPLYQQELIKLSTWVAITH